MLVQVLKASLLELIIYLLISSELNLLKRNFSPYQRAFLSLPTRSEEKKYRNSSLSLLRCERKGKHVEKSLMSVLCFAGGGKYSLEHLKVSAEVVNKKMKKLHKAQPFFKSNFLRRELILLIT